MTRTEQIKKEIEVINKQIEELEETREKLFFELDEEMEIK